MNPPYAQKNQLLIKWILFPAPIVIPEYKSSGLVITNHPKTAAKIPEAIVASFPNFKRHPVYPTNITSIKTDEIKIPATYFGAKSAFSVVNAKNLAIVIAQSEAQIVAKKNQIVVGRSFLVDPKNTESPDKVVKKETTISKIAYNCTLTSIMLMLIKL